MFVRTPAQPETTPLLKRSAVARDDVRSFLSSKVLIALTCCSGAALIGISMDEKTISNGVTRALVAARAKLGSADTRVAAKLGEERSIKLSTACSPVDKLSFDPGNWGNVGAKLISNKQSADFVFEEGFEMNAVPGKCGEFSAPADILSPGDQFGFYLYSKSEGNGKPIKDIGCEASSNSDGRCPTHSATIDPIVGGPYGMETCTTKFSFGSDLNFYNRVYDGRTTEYVWGSCSNACGRSEPESCASPASSEDTAVEVSFDLVYATANVADFTAERLATVSSEIAAQVGVDASNVRVAVKTLARLGSADSSSSNSVELVITIDCNDEKAAQGVSSSLKSLTEEQEVAIAKATGILTIDKAIGTYEGENVIQWEQITEPPIATTSVVIPDSSKNGLKCGNPGNANRVFDLRSGAVTEAACVAACENLDSCVAFSGIMGSWCIGCQVELDTAHSGAVAYKKTSGGAEEPAAYEVPTVVAEPVAPTGSKFWKVSNADYLGWCPVVRNFALFSDEACTERITIVESQLMCSGADDAAHSCKNALNGKLPPFTDGERSIVNCGNDSTSTTCRYSAENVAEEAASWRPNVNTAQVDAVWIGAQFSEPVDVKCAISTGLGNVFDNGVSGTGFGSTTATGSHKISLWKSDDGGSWTKVSTGDGSSPDDKVTISSGAEEPPIATTSVVIPDSSKNGLKCGNPGNANRVFDLRSGAVTEAACVAACENLDSCVAFSGIMGSWCIGCQVELDTAHSGAVAYKKTSGGAEEPAAYEVPTVVAEPVAPTGSKFWKVSNADYLGWRPKVRNFALFSDEACTERITIVESQLMCSGAYDAAHSCKNALDGKLPPFTDGERSIVNCGNDSTSTTCRYSAENVAEEAASWRPNIHPAQVDAVWIGAQFSEPVDVKCAISTGLGNVFNNGVSGTGFGSTTATGSHKISLWKSDDGGSWTKVSTGDGSSPDDKVTV